MIKIAFVFRSAPHGSSASREGLDALLAATAFCNEEDIAVFFIDDGVLNLLIQQQPELILQKDFVSGLKLLDLYDIKQRYVCADSLTQFGLSEKQHIIFCEKIDRTLLVEKLQQAEKILTF
ncbi:protein TusC [Pasteurella canis]|uniref:Protein TusC n=1 Tax=Pasteurella canis TaxID=753 RepID=A0A379EXG8_9PAST|nr:sulfurtransferase complex subunit TusC [Pasteurella canis]GJJ81070.1 protein TusC [Pasteurella canis]SPY33937.1 protein TusC [Pasteurella canis]SUC11012.1 protein TusC [Pasteurella canis]